MGAEGQQVCIDLQSLTEDWPIFLFLKGIGCQKVYFEPQAKEVLDLWTQRMSEYEQEFIQDPENFTTADHFWNEKSSNLSVNLIRCEFAELQVEKIQISLGPVPPMEAPLGIPEEAARRFVEEIQTQSAKETLHRILQILKEYDREARAKDLTIWSNLVADVLCISLQNHLLDKSLQVANDHTEVLKSIWSQTDRVVQIFAAYDPKGSELSQWAKLFETCSTTDLLRCLENHLSSVGGPQMIKLMNYRAQNQAEELIEICFSYEGKFTRQLLQWLAPHWRQKHYARIRESFLKTLKRKDRDLELIHGWIHALLRSSRREAFLELKKLFKKRNFFWKRPPVDISIQKEIVSALSEDRNSETYAFLQEIHPRASVEISNRIEELLQHFKPAGSKK